MRHCIIALLILQPFRRFTYVTAHSPTFPSLRLRHSSLYNPSFAPLPHRSFSNLSLHQRHSSLSNTSVASPTSQVIIQAIRHFTYVTSHSSTLPALYLRHSSFFNPSVALPTSQLILQPFRCFIYVTAHSPNFPSLHLRHS